MSHVSKHPKIHWVLNASLLLLKHTLDPLYCHLIGAGPELHWDPHARDYIVQRPPPLHYVSGEFGDYEKLTQDIVNMSINYLDLIILSHSLTNPAVHL